MSPTAGLCSSVIQQLLKTVSVLVSLLLYKDNCHRTLHAVPVRLHAIGAKNTHLQQREAGGKMCSFFFFSPANSEIKAVVVSDVIYQMLKKVKVNHGPNLFF